MGEVLCTDPLVGKISFTGSTTTGKVRPAAPSAGRHRNFPSMSAALRKRFEHVSAATGRLQHANLDSVSARRHFETRGSGNGGGETKTPPVE